MIEFMVLGTPRSGTTWLSNWLTTEKSICLHEASAEMPVTKLDSTQCDRMLGICDTGLGMLTDFVNSHPARKIVIIRDIAEVNDSLSKIGLPALTEDFYFRLDRIKAPHIYFGDIFVEHKARQIYEFLLEIPFDSARYRALINMNVQPNLKTWRPTAEAFAAFLSEMEGT